MSEDFDAVDNIRQQWNQERPDLSTAAMETIGRLKRCSALLQPRLDSVYYRFSLSLWEFDVLATLLRSGTPYSLAPTTLFSTLMVSSGTMTHRMNLLEKRGFIERKASSEDARSRLVQLTQQGKELVSQAVTEHVQNEEDILSSMSRDVRKQLDNSLRELLSLLEK